MSERRTELFEFIRDTIAHGSIVYSDGERAYAEATRRLQLQHVPIILIASNNPAHKLLPAVHQVASLLKRWLAGTLHDGQSDTHLGYYLDEFTFRFNRRTSRSTVCSGTGSCNRRSTPSPIPTMSSRTRCSGHWS